MKKTDCSVVRDLLPLYIDDVCGAESKELVEEHLKQCRECTAEKVKMKGEIELPKDTGMKALMNIKLTISKRVKRVIVISGTILAIVIFAEIAGYIMSCYLIPVDYAALDGRFKTFRYDDNYTIVSEMNESYWLNGASEEIGKDEDGVRLIVMYVCYMTTPLNELRLGIGNFALQGNSYLRQEWIFTSGNFQPEESGEDGKPKARVTAIYYLPLQEGADTPADKSEAVLIWSE